MIRRLWEAIKWPPPYEGPILTGRLDGFAYLLGWLATFAHLLLWVFVLVLGLDKPWPTVSTLASSTATLLLLSVVIVIHRRMGHHDTLPRSVIWQWWLGPWDSVAATPILAVMRVDRPRTASVWLIELRTRSAITRA